MRILVAGTGTRGDAQPLLALARALQARGHEVDLRLPSDFVPWATELGLSCTAMGGSFREFMRGLEADMFTHPFRAFKAGMRTLFGAQLALATEAPAPDLVIANGAVPAAPTLAQHWGVPCHIVLFQPSMLPDRSYPPIFVRHQFRHPLINRTLWWLWQPLFNLACRPTLDAGRRSLGLPPVGDVIAHLRDSASILLAFDPAFLQPLPCYPMPHACTGSWHLDEGADLAPELEAFLAAGEAPIYVGFGSMPATDPARLTRLVRDASAQLQVRVVLAAGWTELGAIPADPRCLTLSGAPHGALFPRMRAIVHHGGAGTTAAAARAGVPQVVVPHLLDQHFWAHRVAELGIGPRGVPARRLTARRLARALEHALTPAVLARAQALGEQLRATDGLQVAVAQIERWVAERGRDPLAPGARPG